MVARKKTQTRGIGQGKVKLPDGRIVAAMSREARDLRAQNRELRSSEAQEPEAQESEAPEEILPGFAPPPPPIGRPKQVDVATPKPKGGKNIVDPQDIEDYKQLIAAVYAGVAAIAGSDRYRFSEVEAETAARPLARIVRRNTAIRRAVESVSDPIALFAAIAFPTMMKIAAHQADVRASSHVAQTPVSNVRTMERETPAHPSNGRVSYAAVLDRIADVS